MNKTKTIASRPPSRRTFRVLGIALVCSLAAIACGSDSDVSTASTTTTVAAPTAIVAAPAEQDPPAEQDRVAPAEQEVPDDAPVEETPLAEETPQAVEDTPEPATEETATETEEPAAESFGGLAIDKFFDGALAEDIVIVDCVLASGTTTSCYQITVAGFPADGQVGPFCPTTISDTADQVGIWLDGQNIYDIDGQFILDLPEIYNDDNWLLHDEDGHVHVTDTQEAFEAAARPDVAVEYQNHCVEGQIAWLDNGEPITSTVQIPVTPVASGAVTQAGQSLGVTLNGVIIAGQAPVDAILGAYTIAAFDDCGGHINPNEGYHLHGATGCSEVGETSDGETPIFAIALDGYAIHSPLAEADLAAANLDECNGHTTEASGYHYHANSPEDNAVLSCFTGETIEGAAGGGRGGGGGGGRPPRG